MGFLNFLKIYLCNAVMVVVYLSGAESGTAIRFTRVPRVRSRFSTVVFRYVVEQSDGRNACDNSICSISCKLDRRPILPCLLNGLELKNLTENQERKLSPCHTVEGERNSMTFSWFIDTIPPTATIFSNQNYTDAERVTIRVVFLKPFRGNGSFNWANSSLCDVIVYGPAVVVVPSSLCTVEDETDFTLGVSVSRDISKGRIIIRVADHR